MAKVVYLRWNGEAFEPPNKRWGKFCNENFVVGEVYSVQEMHERSGKSHRHYFAAIAEAWENLPEEYQEAPFAQSPEHLRKWALIKCGYADSTTIVCSTKGEAMRMAAFVRPVDPFSVVTVNGVVVTLSKAKSQNEKSMGHDEFQASKSAVLDLLTSMLERKE